MTSRMDAMSVFQQNIRFNTEISAKQLNKSMKNENHSPQNASFVSEHDESKQGMISHGNRVMAGKEFKFLHKLEIRE